MVVENRAFGNRAYCTINEGLGKVMRFGGNDAEVLGAPRLAARRASARCSARALRAAGGMRARSRSSRAASPWATRCTSATSPARRCCCARWRRASRAPPGDAQTLARSLAFIARQRPVLPQRRHGDGQGDHGPGARHRGLAAWSRRCAATAPISASASAGTGDAWFTAPVEMPQGLYFPGFSAADANPDMGDSAIMETIGLGGVRHGGGARGGRLRRRRAAPARRSRFTRAMGEIAPARNPEWTIPALDFAACRPASTSAGWSRPASQPAINTGIAHRKPGVGPGRRGRRARAARLLRAGPGRLCARPVNSPAATASIATRKPMSARRADFGRNTRCTARASRGMELQDPPAERASRSCPIATRCRRQARRNRWRSGNPRPTPRRCRSCRAARRRWRNIFRWGRCTRRRRRTNAIRGTIRRLVPLLQRARRRIAKARPGPGALAPVRPPRQSALFRVSLVPHVRMLARVLVVLAPGARAARAGQRRVLPLALR